VSNDVVFTPFPAPAGPADTPLVTHAGTRYRCTGCGTLVPEGVWIFETVDDEGMVIGLQMTNGGTPGPPVQRGPVVHECGQQGT
jgi:hypothetical protein